jgi:hypothetical protein
MFAKKKHTLILKLFVIFVSFTMTTAGFAASVNSAKIIPTGKVSIIKDGKVVSELTKEGPLPKGALLRCESKCAVKMNDLYLVAEPDTVFAVDPMATGNELMVQDGTVFFAVSETSPPLEFNTPAGVVTTREVALTESELRGYVRVAGNETEIGVIGGGTMNVLTDDGTMAIGPGKQMTIALVDPAKSVAAAGGQAALGSNTTYILGAVGAGLLAAGGIALAAGSGGGGGGGSPSSP